MIHFEDVSKVYANGTKALNHFSLDIERGEFVFIVGASGAGKSTFIKLVTREEKATEGKIIVNGKDLVHMKKRQIPYLRRTMGIVFQDFRLIPKMNVYDNTAFALRVIGTPEKIIRRRVKEVLEQVGLEDKMKMRPSELSGGEQQRTSLARALVNNPELIIADEPTGNVDPALSHEIMQLFCDINTKGTTIVVVTHEHSLVREFGKKIVLIEGGQAHATESEDL